MKISLVLIDEEERSKGRGFLKRAKEKWDQKYPEYNLAMWQKLRDNATRFKKDPDVMNMILVRQREKQPQMERVDSNWEEQLAVNTEDIVSADENEQSGDIINGEDQEQLAWDIKALAPTEQNTHSRAVLTREERELDTSFVAELEKMTSTSMQQLGPRVKLPKIRLDDQMCERRNKILGYI